MVSAALARLLPRRFLNSPHVPDFPLPKTDRWWKRQRIFRFSGWFYADARDKYKPAANRVHHAFKIITKDAKNRPAMLNWFYEKRVAGAVNELGMDYALFTKGLQKADVRLNNRILSILANTEPRTFASLVQLASNAHEKAPE